MNNQLILYGAGRRRRCYAHLLYAHSTDIVGRRKGVGLRYFS